MQWIRRPLCGMYLDALPSTQSIESMSATVGSSGSSADSDELRRDEHVFWLRTAMVLISRGPSGRLPALRGIEQQQIGDRTQLPANGPKVDEGKVRQAAGNTDHYA
jgi:hypothetical protein